MQPCHWCTDSELKTKPVSSILDHPTCRQTTHDAPSFLPHK